MTKQQKLDRYPSLERERDRLDLMLHDVMNNRVTWGKWFQETNGNGKYRVGLSRTHVYGYVIEVFRCAGQSDAINVYDLDTWREELRKLRQGSDCWEPNVLALNSALAALQAENAA